MEIDDGRLRQLQHWSADAPAHVEQLPTDQSLRPEAFVNVIVKRAHLGIGKAIHRIGEHAHHLHERIARHPQRKRPSQHLQRG